MMALREAIERPLLRGHIHLASAIVAPFALVYLLILAETPRAYVGAAVFGTGLILLFSVSAAYHLAPWPTRARRIVGRIDHSTIFVAIGASYTPFCLQELSHAWGISMLTLVWSMCVAGVALKIVWPGAPRWLSVACYLVVGWLALLVLPPLAAAVSLAALVAMLVAGSLYSLGALAYATRWPNPLPRIFGHHEVFHALVTAGFVVLYTVVAVEVLPG